MIVANSYCRSFRFLEKATSRRLWIPFVLLIPIFLPISNANSDQLIEMRESKYNNIYVYQKGEYISMTFGHNRRIFVESVYNPQNEKELPVIYTRYMTVGIVYAKALESILQIGLGGGRTSWYTHKHLPNTLVTAVEIDPEVISLAKKYFGIKEEKTFHIVARDGRLYLARNQDQYDIIFIDAYRGPFVPFHLLTKEFYHIVKTRLKPGGVVVQNIEPSTMLFDSAVVTIRAVFSSLDLFEAGGNIVAIAYDGSAYSTEELVNTAKNLQKRYRFLYSLPDMIRERRALTILPPVGPLTDDFAPVEYLKSIEKHNRKWTNDQ